MPDIQELARSGRYIIDTTGIPTAGLPIPPKQPGMLLRDKRNGMVLRNVGSRERNLFHDGFSTRLRLEERFLRRLGAVTDHDWVDPYDATTAKETISYHPHFLAADGGAVALRIGGGTQLTANSAGTAINYLIPRPTYSAWDTIKWRPADLCSFETVVILAATITNYTVMAGLKLSATDVTATDDDQIVFRYQDTVNSGKWQCIASKAGTDDASDSAVTAAVSTAYHLKLYVEPYTLRPIFLINGVQVAKGAALGSGDLALKPFLSVRAATAANKTLGIRFLVCEKQYAD